MTAEMTQIKRKRGGQQGNQNARTHGFYSSALTPVEISRLQDLIAQQSIEPEMAILLVKFQSSVAHSGPDVRKLKSIARLLVKWYAQKYPLDRLDRAFVKHIIEAYLEHYSGISFRNP